MDLRQYAHALRVHWRAIWICLLIGLGVGGALTLATTPVYSATADVFISTSGASQSESADLQANQIALNRVPTYVSFLTGRNLAQRVIDRTGIDMTAAELAGSVSTVIIPDSAIIGATLSLIHI